jgi:hypothetical protein
MFLITSKDDAGELGAQTLEKVGLQKSPSENHCQMSVQNLKIF